MRHLFLSIMVFFISLSGFSSEFNEEQLQSGFGQEKQYKDISAVRAFAMYGASQSLDILEEILEKSDAVKAKVQERKYAKAIEIQNEIKELAGDFDTLRESFKVEIETIFRNFFNPVMNDSSLDDETRELYRGVSKPYETALQALYQGMSLYKRILSRQIEVVELFRDGAQVIKIPKASISKFNERVDRENNGVRAKIETFTAFLDKIQSR